MRWAQQRSGWGRCTPRPRTSAINSNASLHRFTYVVRVAAYVSFLFRARARCPAVKLAGATGINSVRISNYTIENNKIFDISIKFITHASPSFPRKIENFAKCIVTNFQAIFGPPFEWPSHNKSSIELAFSQNFLEQSTRVKCMLWVRLRTESSDSPWSILWPLDHILLCDNRVSTQVYQFWTHNYSKRVPHVSKSISSLSAYLNAFVKLLIAFIWILFKIWTMYE